jgi:GDP-mannose 6-dehydrogenase
MKIAIFGLGYVGVTSAVCLESLGHTIVGVDPVEYKVRQLQEGLSPIFEPGIDRPLAKAVTEGRLIATSDPEFALSSAEVALVCVGTPSDEAGKINDSFLMEVVDQIVRFRIEKQTIIPILMRSTALPDVHQKLIDRIRREAPDCAPIAYCVHPEFLREGQAIADFMNPPKTIFGCTDGEVEKVCKRLYPGYSIDPRFTTPRTAAMIKYADNCFHALKVTFANETGMLCKQNGVDAREVMQNLCLDKELNISEKYLRPGFAFGGSCLPKDLRAITAWATHEAVPIPMLGNILSSNLSQIMHLRSRILNCAATRIGLVGLAFKAQTNDLRESPFVVLAELLLKDGLHVRIYDPAVDMAKLIGSNDEYALGRLPNLGAMLTQDINTLIDYADLVVVGHNFEQVRWPELTSLKEKEVIDLIGIKGLARLAKRVEGLYWN